MRKSVTVSGAGILCFGLVLGLSFTNPARGLDDEGNPVIKKVMADAHKSKLLQKVVSGSASAQQKSKLFEIYLALWDTKPKKGDEASWNKLAGGLITAAGKVVVGKDDGIAALKKASNCKACHSIHKG